MVDKRVRYTRQQREDCYRLYWIDRKLLPSGRGRVGKYTLKEISEMTGVERHAVSKIARGVM